jgi:hypothetical protein
MEAMASFDALDRSVRRYVYEHFVDQERPPTAGETAAALKLPLSEIQVAFKRLHESHVLVLEPDRLAIRFAQPFCAVPTRYQVLAQGHSWWGTCAWDALGIPAALNADAEISATCPDCEEPIIIRVQDGNVVGSAEIIHFVVPAKHWWDDIFFT